MGKISDGVKAVGGELFKPEIALGKLACTNKKSAVAAFLMIGGLVTAGVLGRNFVMSHLKEFGLGAAGLHTVTYLGMKISDHRKGEKAKKKEAIEKIIQDQKGLLEYTETINRINSNQREARASLQETQAIFAAIAAAEEENLRASGFYN